MEVEERWKEYKSKLDGRNRGGREMEQIKEEHRWERRRRKVRQWQEWMININGSEGGKKRYLRNGVDILGDLMDAM